MQRTTFHIEKMDCPSEEQLIRLRLRDITGIHTMEFDLPARKLEVLHRGDAQEILHRLSSLDLGARMIGSESVSEFDAGSKSGDQRRLLMQVLIINLFFFGLEMLAGFLARSMGLVADSLDMLADAMVYTMALMAAGSTPLRKIRVATFSGYLQMFLALAGLAEVIRRFAGTAAMPSFATMMIVSALALAANAVCLYLLRKSNSKETHMRASMIFTSNDVVINMGVIVAGGLVFLTRSRYPDLVVGVIVFGIVARGAIRILKLR